VTSSGRLKTWDKPTLVSAGPHAGALFSESIYVSTYPQWRIRAMAAQNPKKPIVERIRDNWITVLALLLLSLIATAQVPLLNMINTLNGMYSAEQEEIDRLTKERDRLQSEKIDLQEELDGCQISLHDCIEGKKQADLLSQIVLGPGDYPDFGISEWQPDGEFYSPKSSIDWEHVITPTHELFQFPSPAEQLSLLRDIPVNIWHGVPLTLTLSNQATIPDLSPKIFVARIPYKQIDPLIPVVFGSVLQEAVRNMSSVERLFSLSTAQQFQILNSFLILLLHHSNVPENTRVDILDITWTREDDYNVLDAESAFIFHNVSLQEKGRSSPFQDYYIWMRTIVISDNTGRDTNFYIVHAMFPSEENRTTDKYFNKFNHEWMKAFRIRFSQTDGL
jgi:cell division protein FtsB